MCKPIHTSLVRDAHGYTRSKMPWQIAELRAPRGMRDFGEDVREAERGRRQSRFLTGCGVAAALWLLLLVF